MMETENPQMIEAGETGTEVAKRRKSDLGRKIKFLLILKNKHLIEIARKHQIWPSDLTKVVYGKRRTPWIRKALAEELEMSVEELFSTTEINSNLIK